MADFGVCGECGVVVADPTLHANWHDTNDQPIEES